MATVNLVTCIHRTMKPVTAQSLLGAIALSGHLVGWSIGQDADIGRNRSLKASEFLWNQTLGDVMVFVDDDIGFTVDGFKHLVDTCLETQEIVCGMYVVRDTAYPHPACALFPGQKITDMDREPVPIRYGATGFMAIHRRVLEHLQREYPWGHPIPVVSGPRRMVPFFLEFVHEGEYLSEDFAFCQRAADLGVKTWCDPRINLTHNGERAYTLKDLAFNASMQQVTMTVDEGGPDPTGILADLAAYWKLSPQDAWAALTAHPSQQAIADMWQERSPQTPQEVLAFYEECPHYLLDLAKFNMDNRYSLKVYHANRLQGKIIDFGGGIGTFSLMLASGGREATYVDLPSPHRTFAEWRFERHEAPIHVASSLQELGAHSYDALVGIDVFEHIHPQELEALVQNIADVLKPGGLLLDVNDFRTTPIHPQHYESEDLWVELLKKHGFNKQANGWQYTASPVGAGVGHA